MVLGEVHSPSPSPDPALIGLLADAHRWFEDLRTGVLPLGRRKDRWCIKAAFCRLGGRRTVAQRQTERQYEAKDAGIRER